MRTKADIEKENINIIILLSFLLILLIGIIVYQQYKINLDKEQFRNIKLCLSDKDVTKDLYGAFINDEGKIECHYGVGNGIVERKELSKLEDDEVKEWVNYK